MIPGEYIAIALVLGALLAVVVSVHVLNRRYDFPPEVPRKSIHVLMGLGCSAFPWIFSSPFPVWILAALATIPILRHQARSPR